MATVIKTKKSKINQYEPFPPGTGWPAIRALKEYIGVTKPEQLVKYSEAELLKLHGVGPKSIKLIKAYLKSKNLSFS